MRKPFEIDGIGLDWIGLGWIDVGSFLGEDQDLKGWSNTIGVKVKVKVKVKHL